MSNLLKTVDPKENPEKTCEASDYSLRSIIPLSTALIQFSKVNELPLRKTTLRLPSILAPRFCSPPMSTKKKRRRPLAVDLGQTFIRWFFRFFLFLVYRIRVHKIKYYPDDRGMLICSNHQSYLDPLIIGIACPHAVNYLGRKSLFRSPFLAWILKFNDTIPIDREGTGVGGMKETLRRLKKGESVVIFPEGTRTIDGELLPLMLGFCAVARRSKATLMPLAFDGAYQSFPRNSKIPLPGRIHTVMAEPIRFEQYKDLADEEIAEMLQHRIKDCLSQAQRYWRRSMGFESSKLLFTDRASEVTANAKQSQR